MPIMTREMVIAISEITGPENEINTRKGSRKIPMILLVIKTTNK
jgi:hypothetical protein